ncbi:MAG TPA: nodulation protein E [Sedimenticola sp.]|nr:nodulation protein E [Sedimenticola sp.]
MSRENKSKPLSASRLRGPEANFSAYCKAELERWRTSGKSFNEALFLEAMELAQRKLRVRMRRGSE